MEKISAHRLGLALGSMFAVVHVVWSLLVVLGWAQPVVDFVFRAHMVQPVLVVGSFSITSALLVIALAFCVGYAFGRVAGTLWNKVGK